MAYKRLNTRTLTGTADTTFRNTGNWTNAFTSDVINQQVAFFECHHMVVQAAPAGASATIYIGQVFYSFTSPGAGAGSEWDPAQPMLLQPGDSVFFFWNAVATGTPPVVTMWFRYDDSIRDNQLAGGGAT